MAVQKKRKNGRRWLSTAVLVICSMLFVLWLSPANADHGDVVHVPLQTEDIFLIPGSYEIQESEYIVIKLTRSLIRAEVDGLAAAGVRLLSYLGNAVFIAGIDPGALTVDVIKNYRITAATSWKAENKASSELQDGSIPDYAQGEDGSLKLSVLFFADKSLEQMEAVLSQHAASYSRQNGSQLWHIQLPRAALNDLLLYEGIHIIEPTIPKQPLLDEARAIIHADAVHQAKIGANPPTITYDGLTGEGIIVQVSEGVWDGHPDFIKDNGQSRVFNPSPNFGGRHGTLVAGIIGGDGTLSASMQDSPYAAEIGHWRGIAPEVTLYDGSYGGDLGKLIDVSNHSYLISYGEYNTSIATVDKEIRGDSGAKWQWPQVWSAGNNGFTPQYDDEEGYYAMYAPAKNGISVGSVNANDGGLSYFSSLGPTFDGRIKPDLVAPGGQNTLPEDFYIYDDKIQISYDYIRVYNKQTGSLDASWEFNEDGNAQGWFQYSSCQISDIQVKDGNLNFLAGMYPLDELSPYPCSYVAYGWNESVNLATNNDQVFVIRYKMFMPGGHSTGAGKLWWHDAGVTDPQWITGEIPIPIVIDNNWHVLEIPVGQWGQSHYGAFDGWQGTIDKLGIVPYAYNWPGITSTYYDEYTHTPAYAASQGTSEASPMVTGSIALVLQNMRDLHGLDLAQNPPLPSTIKAILIQTAQDLVHDISDYRDWHNPDTYSPVLYYAGPDYATGYGLIDVQSAVEFVGSDPGPKSPRRMIHEEEIDGLEKHVYKMWLTENDVIKNNGQVKMTLAWDDWPGDPAGLQTMPMLVNDLDLYAIDPDGTTHLPWTLEPYDGAYCYGTGPGCGELDPIYPADVVPAWRGTDHRNNVEMVQVYGAKPGQWQIVIDAHNVPMPTQAYSLVSSQPLKSTLDKPPAHLVALPMIIAK